MNVLSVLSKWKKASLIFAVAASSAVVVAWYFSTHSPPVPQRPLRIGFESNPPVQIRTENGFSGLAVDTVNEAAKRAGIKLEWVEPGTSSDDAFRKGLVDLWPLMVDYPDRRKRVHFARPWMHSRDVLLVRDGSPNLDRRFKGSIAVFKMPLHVRLAEEQFPEAHVVIVPAIEDVIKQVCNGADAGFLEARVALTSLREKPKECSSISLSCPDRSWTGFCRRSSIDLRIGEGSGSNPGRNRQDVPKRKFGGFDRKVQLFWAG